MKSRKDTSSTREGLAVDDKLKISINYQFDAMGLTFMNESIKQQIKYMREFSARQINADQFQKKWLLVWGEQNTKRETISMPLQELLAEIFYAIEDYDGDPEARPENGLDEEGLRKAIHRLLKEFEQMT